MGRRTSHSPGTFSWVDLQTTDQDSAKSFYAGLLGVEFDDFPLGDGNVYSMARVGGESAFALSGLPAGADIPPHWNSYVTVESADETAARAREAGANVIEEPFDVFTFGRMALFQDPTGAMLCVWEARDNIGAGRVNDVGCLTWNELHTSDPDTAAKFYGELFGWTFDEQDMGGPDPYRTIKNGDRMNGGIIKQTGMEEGAPPNWLPYFTVEDADKAAAQVQESGGQVHYGPVTIPTENQPKIAVLGDPQGAAFAVFAGPTED